MKTLSTVNKPVDVFKSCPSCECSELIPVMGDVICSRCSWDSITLYADALFEKQIGFLFCRPTHTSDNSKALSRAQACSPCISVVA